MRNEKQILEKVNADISTLNSNLDLRFTLNDLKKVVIHILQRERQRIEAENEVDTRQDALAPLVHTVLGADGKQEMVDGMLLHARSLANERDAALASVERLKQELAEEKARYAELQSDWEKARVTEKLDAYGYVRRSDPRTGEHFYVPDAAELLAPVTYEEARHLDMPWDSQSRLRADAVLAARRAKAGVK